VKGQRREQDRVDDGKDGGVRADAERQGEHRDRGETGLRDQEPGPEREVAGEPAEQPQPAGHRRRLALDGPAATGRLRRPDQPRNVRELGLGLRHRLVVRTACRARRPVHLLGVQGDFLDDVGIDRGRAETRANERSPEDRGAGGLIRHDGSLRHA
jgi:hypothetical protein